MKTLKLLIAVLLMTFASSVFALDQCMSGSWYFPDFKHEGMSIEVSSKGDQTIAYFFSYRNFDGLQTQNWMVFVGGNEYPTTVMDAYDTEPPVTPGRKPYEWWVGTVHLTQIDNNTIEYEYDWAMELDEVGIEYDRLPLCLGASCKGSRTLKRLTQPIDCL